MTRLHVHTSGVAHSCFCGWVDICIVLLSDNSCLMADRLCDSCVLWKYFIWQGDMCQSLLMHNAKKKSAAVSIRSFSKGVCVCSTCCDSLWRCCIMSVGGMHNWRVNPNTISVKSIAVHVFVYSVDDFTLAGCIMKEQTSGISPSLPSLCPLPVTKRSRQAHIILEIIPAPLHDQSLFPGLLPLLSPPTAAASYSNPG